MARFALRLLALVALGAVAFADEHVLTLTGETFSDVVKKHDKLVVEFYAPWCGHCKNLAPEYEKAAGELKADDIVLAKVDATEEKNKELAQKFGVQGFPTLKIFRGSETAEEYQGPRDAPGIVKYCKRAFGPASQELKTEAEVKDVAKSEFTVLGVFPKGEDSAEYKTFFEVAGKMRDEASFAHVFSAKLVSDCSDCKDATVIVYKDWDEPVTKMTGKITADSLKEFVEKTATPELVSLDRTNKNKKALAKMFADQLPKLLGSAPADFKEIKAFKENLVTITKKYEGKIHVLYMDPSGNEGALNFFGAKTSDLPAMFVHEPESNGKFIEKDIKTGDMVKWAEKYSKGEIEKVVKSEDIPKKNDDPVFVLVAKQFEEVVTSGKDVFIEFYAPWCGHCKNLAPEWEKLGKKLEKAKNVVIAKMDATANDIPDVKGMKFDVKGFPTLYFVTGADKKVHTYSGQRTAKDLLAFVKKTADPANLEGIDFDEEAEEPAAAAEEDEYEEPAGDEADEYEEPEEDKDEL